MAQTLLDVIATTTQAAVFNLIMGRHRTNSVPTSSWTGLRNIGLSLTQTLSQLYAGLQNAVAASIAGLFLDYAGAQPGMDAATAAQADAALTLFAKSQYQLDRSQPQATVGLHLLTGSSTGPTLNLASGQVVDGTPGSLAAGAVLFTNSEAGTLAPRSLQVPGLGQGLTITEVGSGARFSAYYSGVSSSLSLGVMGSHVIASLATDSDGNPTTTAAQLVTAMGLSAPVTALMTAAVIGAGSLVMGAVPVVDLDGGGLLLQFTANTAGASGNIPVGSAVVLKAGNLPGVSFTLAAWQAGTWVTSQGADLETATALKARCRGRWGTVGVAGNEDAMRFWATAIPNGYRVSPVSSVQVLANSNAAGTGFLSNGCTVVVVGPSGALTGPQLTAVRANFTAPVTSVVSEGVPGLESLASKTPVGMGVSVVSAANYTITLLGSVNVFASSGVSIADVQTAVANAVAAYQRTLTCGMVIYPQLKVAGVLGEASPYQAAISSVDLSGMAASITLTNLQYPVIDVGSLSYNLV